MTPFLRGLGLFVWFCGTICGVSGDLRPACIALILAGAMLLGANALEAEQ
jgi:hypothetical protein